MSKYIIKNCDNGIFYVNANIEEYLCEFSGNPCANSDCLIKQIVEKCKRIKTFHSNGTSNYSESDYSLGRMATAEDILKLLDISEVD